MKKALKIFSLGVTVVKILGGDLSEIAEIPRKVINIYGDTDWSDVAETCPFW